MEGRPWALPFEHGDLLAKCEDFQGYISSASQEHA